MPECQLPSNRVESLEAESEHSRPEGGYHKSKALMLEDHAC